MVRVQLLHMYASDVNGSQFEWSADLERGNDGRVILSLVPTVEDGVEIEAPNPIAIEEGGQLFERLCAAWYEHGGEDISEQTWQEVASKVSKFDKALGQGLKAQLREEYDPEPVPPSAADLWARRAQWERPFKGRAVGYASPENMRRASEVRQFVQDHLAQTGNLPTGRHRIHEGGAQTFEATFPDISDQR